MAIRKKAKQQDQPHGGNGEGAASRMSVSESGKKHVGRPQNKLKDETKSHFSPRRQKLIENLLSQRFKTVKDALTDAGYAKSTATKAPSEIIGNYRFQTAMQEIMTENGVDENRLTKVLSEGLEATKVISAMVIAPSGEGMKDAGGMTKDFIEVPDFLARHKFLQTALELRGDYPDKKTDANQFETHEQRLERLRGGV